ncbi:hypothetical protein ONA23_02395 [Mycoplasmopsis cynos]|uniref:hypothetical protein n=1 Tax=Mycoplasmopsis cynos TaxID=171284 RepID=UPI0022075722|nr:hypothetical protein [Mycoplasmopsis cynos]UWV82165.1 hypothetical protein NW067_03795 [Mycoplasmopsis cynos]WAM07015.1 hypothetical protein ONA23_02395 [Mycoplasmopsis cynos]
MQNTESIFKKNEDPLKLNDIENNFRKFLEFYDASKTGDYAFFLNLSNKNIVLEKKQSEKENIINFDKSYLYLLHKENFDVSGVKKIEIYQIFIQKVVYLMRLK